jgi:hypothetical protein
MVWPVKQNVGRAFGNTNSYRVACAVPEEGRREVVDAGFVC